MKRPTTVSALAFAALLSSAGDAAAGKPGPQAPAPDLRVQAWHGNALCYSGYRAGQSPKTETFPSQAQVLEDLRILERKWKLVRLYGSDRHSDDVLEVIRREGQRAAR